MESNIFCAECGIAKQTRYCNSCGKETPNSFRVELFEIQNSKAHLRSHIKSGERIDGKPKKEIIQYCGNKDENVISEIEKSRERDGPTIVIHRLWRRFGDIFKKVHEHEK